MRVPSKILSVIVLTFGLVGVASAQQLTRAQTAQGFMAYGMPAKLANDVAALARQTSGITLDAQGGASVSIINVSQPSNANITYLAGGADPTAPFGAWLGLSGGGNSVLGTAGAAWLSASTSAGSKVTLSAPATDGNIDFWTGGTNKWSLTQFGDLNQAAAGGDLIYTHSAGTRDFTTSVAAAGASQGTATALTSRWQRVTGATGANGVVLPTTPVSGQHAAIINTTGASNLLVYPGVGDFIGNGLVDAAVTVSGGAIIECIAESASKWWCYEAPAA